jgi:Uma2 family endonuclease
MEATAAPNFASNGSTGFTGFSDEVLKLLKEQDVIIPPTEDELPYEDGVPMESDRHAQQIELLKEALQLHWADKPDVCIAGNLGVYYSLDQAQKQNFRAPDFFIALGVPRRQRKSYVIWQEGKAPDLVIELLSDSTADADRGIKKRIYQDSMRVPEYILFDMETGAMEAFRLGIAEKTLHTEYIGVGLGKDNDFVSNAAPHLGLRCWEGEFRSTWGVWLRWYDTETGEFLPTGIETARLERKRAERLAEKLRALGVNPDEA